MDVVSQIKSTISTNQIIAIFSTMLIHTLTELQSKFHLLDLKL